jgi:hypothetical protein
MLVKVNYLLAVVIGLLTFATRSEAAVLYGATASGSPGELYILNPATGAMVQDVGPLNDVTGLNYGMTGLAFHPITGVLYGSTHNLSEDNGGNPLTVARLVTINPQTAQVSVIGQFNAGNAGRPATMTDLAFDAAGNLFGVSSVGGPQLYSIDISTGQATIIGNTGLSSTTGGGLAISPGGTAYGTPTASRFGTYDLGTGAYTNITNPTKPGGGGAYAALDFDGNVLYGLNSAPGSPPPTFLVTIAPDGTVTNIGQSVDALDAIAFLVPEPSAIGLMAIGLVAVTCKRRRHARVCRSVR